MYSIYVLIRFVQLFAGKGVILNKLHCKIKLFNFQDINYRYPNFYKFYCNTKSKELPYESVIVKRTLP